MSTMEMRTQSKKVATPNEEKNMLTMLGILSLNLAKRNETNIMKPKTNVFMRLPRKSTKNSIYHLF